MSNAVILWKGAVEPAASGASGNEIQTWKGAVEPAALSIFRRGGRFVFDREIERQEQLTELIELVEPEVKPVTQAAPVTPEATIAPRQRVSVPAYKRSRVDTLLAETGITLEELLVIISM